MVINSLSLLMVALDRATTFSLISTFVDYDNQTINIYLNTNTTEIVKYWIIDMLGKTINYDLHTANQGVSIITIDGKRLLKGIYYLTASNGKSILTRKIFY